MTLVLPIAIRAHTVRPKRQKRRRAGRNESSPETWTEYVLVFDTETSIDRTQQLLFGSYRVCRWQAAASLVCLEEGFIHADDLRWTDPRGFARLARYVKKHRADVVPGYEPALRLHSRTTFVRRVLYPLLCRGGAMVVGFNLPFDLSRLAVRAAPSRQSKTFSFIVFDHDGGDSLWRPRLRIKARDRRSAFLRLGRPRKSEGPVRPGRFLDLKTLVHALTGEGMTLATACTAFGVTHGKRAAERHGVITEEYIAYNRRDVLATAELLERLRAEFDRHPLALLPDVAYSEASIAKAYLKAMGIQPLTGERSSLTHHQKGAAMSAYFGGRAEGHIRKWPVPVVLLDFLAMYPTINTLLGLWGWHTARCVRAVEATADVRRLLERVTLEDVFKPSFWEGLTFFARIVPEGDILPVRAAYGADGGYNIGINPLTNDKPLWYAGPDLVASVLLAGKPPRVLTAFRVVPEGRARGLRPVRLRGTVEVDPRRGDFFRSIVELRKHVANDPTIASEERRWLAGVLKTMANAGSYGIYAELNQQDPSQKPAPVTVYAGGRPFRAQTTRPEDPGRFACWPIAALITAGARLMLATLERMVTDRGGTYAFCDTDSMAVVATKDGGLVSCPGGPYRLPDGREAIQALSRLAVDQIVQRFAHLSLYDRGAVPGSILKVEAINVDPETEEPRELWAYVISAKRYALFTREP